MKPDVGKFSVAFLRIAIGWHFLYEGLWKLMQTEGWSCVAYLDAAQGPLAPVFTWMASQPWIVAVGDWFVMLGLTGIGLALMTGLFVRLAALAGIAFMAMFYGCQPPPPFAEAMSGADGRFFFFERNVIEALGLAAVAVMPCRICLRRTVLPGLVALAVFGGCFYRQYRAGAFKKTEAVTSATVKVHEFTALAALRKPYTEKTKIGGVTFSRLALGGDFIAGYSQARDLIWTDEFMRRYNAGVSLGRLVRYCLHCGIDATFTEARFLTPMRAAAKAVGKDLKFFANCASADDAASAVTGGACGVYVRPQTADAYAEKGDVAGLKSLFARLKATRLPTGIGAEDIATVRFCTENGIVPDYWVLAFHSLDYPAATLKTRCNNIWCTDPAAAAAYMKTRPEPWVAIRGLAGGALAHDAAYAFARKNGACAVSLDLLDYNVVETVNKIVKPDTEESGKRSVK